MWLCHFPKNRVSTYCRLLLKHLAQFQHFLSLRLDVGLTTADGPRLRRSHHPVDSHDISVRRCRAPRRRMQDFFHLDRRIQVFLVLLERDEISFSTRRSTTGSVHVWSLTSIAPLFAVTLASAEAPDMSRFRIVYTCLKSKAINQFILWRFRHV